MTEDEFRQYVEANNVNRESQGKRLEVLRLAKEILVENARSKAVEEREITAETVLEFSNKLLTYVQNG